MRIVQLFCCCPIQFLLNFENHFDAKWCNRGQFLNWRTLDSARQFAAAARIGYNASATLSALESVLSPVDDGYVLYPAGDLSDGDGGGLELPGLSQPLTSGVCSRTKARCGYCKRRPLVTLFTS